ncbi:hypothetical protein KKG90_08575 [Candidatus Bipolaricaulota bacterium]|nr:hypothetical protein [Candidatus Bipolaricaulota bacterium]
MNIPTKQYARRGFAAILVALVGRLWLSGYGAEKDSSAEQVHAGAHFLHAFAEEHFNVGWGGGVLATSVGTK